MGRVEVRLLTFNTPLEIPATAVESCVSQRAEVLLSILHWRCDFYVGPSRRRVGNKLSILHWRCAGDGAYVSATSRKELSILHWRCFRYFWLRRLLWAACFQYSIGDASTCHRVWRTDANSGDFQYSIGDAGQCVEFHGDAVYQFFQYSIGDAPRKQKGACAYASRRLSILYWRCIADTVWLPG